MAYPHEKAFREASLVAGVALLISMAALPAAAGPAAELRSGSPAEVLKAAAETCLSEIYNLRSAVEVFRAAGWEVGELEAGAFELSGPSGIYAFLNEEGYCRMEAEGVGLDEARSIARKLANSLYPEQFKDADGGPCAGYTITTIGGLVGLSLDGLGQDPTCPDPGGSSIVVETAR